ncbi:MAG: gliding motility-associated ABC transporter substrate-binding protein GldG, partial [Paludibacteraceae bacterium]
MIFISDISSQNAYLCNKYSKELFFDFRMKQPIKNTIFLLIAIVFLIVVSHFFFFRIDLTSDKRHSLSPQTKSLMKTIQAPIEATVFLSGNLNPGFLRLKNSTTEMLTSLRAYSSSEISIRYKNPSDAESEQIREQNHAALEQRGITGTTVYEKDKEGKAIRKIVYPWVELSCQGKTIPVNLLKNDRSLSGEENLNISIENLEFELTNAVRRLIKKDVEKIAFLEGHGELSEQETFDISKSLSRYFQIDRGIIGSNVDMLDEYKSIIIAKPTKPFAEKDKFIIDQYLMNGGTLVWLLDGIQISEESLSGTGTTPAMPLELNLSDMLFRYGARINPVVVEDVQSTLMPVNIAPAGEKPEFEPIPWIYSPLLLTSSEHPVTKGLPPVKAHFASTIELVGDNKDLSKHIVLATSSNTHLTLTPANISTASMPDLKNRNYFNLSFVPVGVILEGAFLSVFANRMVPQELSNSPAIVKYSAKTARQAVIADGDIIRNDILHVGDSVKTLPLGYDPYTRQQFGNNALITNIILYLTDNDGWMDLRSRTIPLRL